VNLTFTATEKSQRLFEQKIAKITKSYSPGPRVAAILSVIETCRRLNIPICQYLRSVLPGLAEFSTNRVSELTPSDSPPKLSESVRATPPLASD
jgi:hypothetical protein